LPKSSLNIKHIQLIHTTKTGLTDHQDDTQLTLFTSNLSHPSPLANRSRMYYSGSSTVL